MPYIFYDRNNNETVGKIRPQRYTVDGVDVTQDSSILPASWDELTVVYGTYPTKTEEQAYTISWSKQGFNWVQTIGVRDLTTEELEERRVASIPSSITKCQFFKALWQILGKEKNEILTIINNIANTDTKRQRLLELQDEYYIRRDSDFVTFIKNHFGYTDLQIDNFFTTAKNL